MTDERDVVRALLGRWPNQVAQWGKEGIAAFISELEAEGLTPKQALVGIRMHRSDFPPSVAAVSDNVRKDPSVPTFDEAWQLIRVVLAARTQVRKAIWASGERAGLDEDAMIARSQDSDIHPLVTSFIERQGGPMRLRSLGLDDEENPYREIRRRELAQKWAEHCDVFEGREVAALVAGRRGEGLGRLDPLVSLGRPERVQITTGGEQ